VGTEQVLLVCGYGVVVVVVVQLVLHLVRAAALQICVCAVSGVNVARGVKSEQSINNKLTWGCGVLGCGVHLVARA